MVFSKGQVPKWLVGEAGGWAIFGRCYCIVVFWSTTCMQGANKKRRHLKKDVISKGVGIYGLANNGTLL